MARTGKMTAHLGDALSEFVATDVGCDLIRRDKERLEQRGVARLKAELSLAFAAPDSSFHLIRR
jgi:hypothetical protein